MEQNIILAFFAGVASVYIVRFIIYLFSQQENKFEESEVKSRDVSEEFGKEGEEISITIFEKEYKAIASPYRKRIKVLNFDFEFFKEWFDTSMTASPRNSKETVSFNGKMNEGTFLGVMCFEISEGSHAFLCYDKKIIVFKGDDKLHSSDVSCSVCGGQDVVHEQKTGRGNASKSQDKHNLMPTKRVSWRGIWDVWTCNECGNEWKKLVK